MKKWVIIFLFLVIIFLFGGCNHPFSQHDIDSYIVSRVDVYCESCETILRRSYSDRESVRLILLFIRKLGPDFPARTDVDAISGKTMHITLRCANGALVTYRFRNNLYLQKNDGPWRQINQENMGGFYQLLVSLPGDAPEMDRNALPREVQTQRVFFPAYGRLRNAGKR